MSLSEYWQKRNFNKTMEPSGDIKLDEKDNIYVVQKHHSLHLHYDLRLEREGVLKSWAVPKEPPAKRGIKRLAIQTEEHPIDYSSFEGTIPKGEYGAGTVEIWDSGSYNADKWDETKIIINLRGEKLKGKYCLLRFKPRDNKESQGTYLFFKLGQSI